MNDDDNCSAASSTSWRVRAKHRGYEGFDGAHEGQWKGDFVFVQAADTQLGMIDSYINKNKGKPDWDIEVQLTTKAVEAVNRMQPRPRFFIVCGDLVDAMPDVPYSSGRKPGDGPLGPGQTLHIYARAR